MASTTGRKVIIPLTNKSGGGVIAGDVVIIDTTTDESFTTTTSAGNEQSIGIAQETIASNAVGKVLLQGYAALVNVSASATRGHYLETHTVAKQATSSGTRSAGAFGQILKAGTTPSAYIWGMADQTAAAAGGVTGATDINVYTGGDITLNNTTLAAVTGPTDLVVAAASGDCLMVGVSARPVTTTAQSITFDFATIVSAAPVNYVFAASGTPVNIPVPWFIGAGEVSACNGGYPYVVQAGDISGGNVTLRLYFRTSGSRVIEADAAAPLVTWVHNLKQ